MIKKQNADIMTHCTKDTLPTSQRFNKYQPNTEINYQTCLISPCLKNKKKQNQNNNNNNTKTKRCDSLWVLSSNKRRPEHKCIVED